MRPVVFFVVFISVLGASCGDVSVGGRLGNLERDRYDVGEIGEPVYEDGFILISSFGELCKIGKGSGYPLKTHEDSDRIFYGYKLTGDIDASASREVEDGGEFEPIGYEKETFGAVFDGQGFKIKNLYVKNENPMNGGSGLFRAVGYNAIVENVVLENVEIDGIGCVGGIAGTLRGGGRISNCRVAGVVRSGSRVGGVVGCTDQYTDTVSNCFSSAIIIGEIGEGGVGGIVGRHNGVLINSYATGDVVGDRYVGGLVGVSVYGTVENCFAATSLKGAVAVGGLVGMEYGVGNGAKNSYWNVAVSGIEVPLGSINEYSQGWEKSITLDSWASAEISAGGMGKTTAEMMKRETYKNWDFSGVWEIVEGGRYPVLRGGVSEKIVF